MDTIWNMAYLKATHGRLQVQRNKLREIEDGIHQELLTLDKIILEFDRVITEHEVREQAGEEK